jgi:hypothetical protein
LEAVTVSDLKMNEQVLITNVETKVPFGKRGAKFREAIAIQFAAACFQ